MTRGILKLLSPSPTTIGRCSSFTFVGLVTAVVLASATPAVAIVTLDQETGADRYPSGLRVATFFPVGQTFVPTRSLHVGVELLLSMSCSETAPLPPAIYTVLLRERSLAGPVLASGTTPAFTCPELSDPCTEKWTLQRKLVFLGEFKMSKKTKKRSRRRFTDEFKAETVKLVKQSDRTPEVRQRLKLLGYIE